jgi:hypothetical protein
MQLDMAAAFDLDPGRLVKAISAIMGGTAIENKDLKRAGH